MSMADEMWELIPAIYRRRDADAGDVLRALVEVFGEQADILKDDIARLYDNCFIETCDDWVVPYIGELVGARTLTQRGEPASEQDAARLARIAPTRMLVANTVRWRRRKGAFSLINEIAWDVARWRSLAVEYGSRLAAYDNLRLPAAEIGLATANGLAALRDPASLARIGGPVDAMARTIDVRAADGTRSPGRFGAANIGLFVFRQDIVSISHADAASIDEEGPGRFTFDPLGRDIPLYHPSPESETDGSPGLPGAITRGILAARRADDDPDGPGWRVDPALYGHGGCTMIWEQREEEESFHAVEPERIVPANLSHWRDRPTGNQVALDPETGRIAIAEHCAPWRLRVTYAYCDTGSVGAPLPAGPVDDPAFDAVHMVAASREEAHDSLKAALEQWRKDKAASTLIEFHDNGTYDEDRLAIDFSRAARRLVIRAAPGCRPIIRLANREAGAMDGWRVRGTRDGEPGPAGSSLTLEGLTIAERGLLLEGFGGALNLRNCTLIPGWNGGRSGHGAVSMVFENCTGPVTISRSITGPLLVRANEAVEAPLPLKVCDSILDAGEGRDALFAPDTVPYVKLDLRRSTVIGGLAVHSVGLIENAIVSDRVEVVRRQTGCVRFSFIAPGSRTPRRFSCLPERGDDEGMAPAFVSRVFGKPGYAQFAATADGQFQRGADDQGELGAFHDQFWTIRDANLRATLADHVPAGVNIGIIYLS
jgi:hypothetical protein